MISAVPVSRTSSASSPRICAWMVTSSAVVGSSAMSSRGRQASAIAISARCRMPPDSWWGYASSRRRGSGMPTRSSRSAASRRAGSLRHAPVPTQHLGDLQPDRDDRVQRRQRVLEHHADLAAAQLAHPRLGQREQVGAIEDDIAGHPHVPPREQPHDRQRGHRLPAARLADQADDLTGRDVEVDSVDGDGVGFAAARECDAQVADL